MGPFSRVSVAAFLSAVMSFASAVAAIAADDPPPMKPAASTDASSKSAGKARFIVDNPDGTFTVQLVPARGEQGAAQKGLVIPPQVVVPLLRPPPASSSHGH